VARAAALDAAGRPYLIPSPGGEALMPAVARYGPHGVAVGEAPARAAGRKCSVRGPSCYLARFADLPECARAAAPFPVLDVDGAMRLDLLYAHVAGPGHALAARIAALCALALARDGILHLAAEEEGTGHRLEGSVRRM